MMLETMQTSTQAVGDPAIDNFLALWGLDHKCKDVLLSLDAGIQQRVMSGFHATDMSRANQMFMGFVKSVVNRSGGSGAPTAPQAFAGGNFHSAPTLPGNTAIDDFLARWGLDGKARDALGSLDPMTQQRVMNEFQPTDISRANHMFMGFMKTVSGKSGVATGNAAIDGFVAQWGLDGKSQDVLCSLDPVLQQRVMSDFRPTNISRVNQMFMGFVKSVTNKLSAPTAQEAYEGSSSSFLHTPATSGNAALDGFVLQWGLDAKAQDLLFSLDFGMQQRVISEFKPTNPSRASQMFMAFVKSVRGGAHHGAQTAQPSFDGGGNSLNVVVATGTSAIDSFVAQWGLDFACQEVLRNLDMETQRKVMSEFQAPDRSRANQVFMAFVKVLNKSGQISVQQTSLAPIAQQSIEAPMAQLPSGNSNSIFTSHVDIYSNPLDQFQNSTQLGQVQYPQVTQTSFGAPSSQIAFGAPAAQQTVGTPISQPAFGDSNSFFNGGGGAAPRTGDSTIDGFVDRWGLDELSLQTLLGLDPDSQQRVMRKFQPACPGSANRIFIGFVSSVMSKPPTTQQALVAPTSQPPLTAPTTRSSFGDSISALSSPVEMEHMIPPPERDPNTEAFAAQWGLDPKCLKVLDNLDPATQQKVMSGFQPPDISRANQIFMGFVKSVMNKGGGVNKPKIAQFVAQWNLDPKCHEVLMTLDPETCLRVISGFKPSSFERASRMFMGFVRSIDSRQSHRHIPY